MSQPKNTQLHATLKPLFLSSQSICSSQMSSDVCSCRTSVGVRRRALALLLEHGVFRHESLSVCEVC